MSAGKRYKFQGSHISILTTFGGATSPPSSITGITAANPPVLTSSAHGRSNGDVVYVESVGGMVEVNDRAYIVSNKTTGTFELYGVNGSGYTAYTSGGTFDYGSWSEFCEITQFSRTGDAATEIPAETVCSEEKEYEVGLGGQGTIALSFNYAPLTSTAQIALDAWDRSKAIMAVKVQLPSTGGTIVRLAFVQQTSESAGVNGLWTASANLRLTGPALRIAAA